MGKKARFIVPPWPDISTEQWDLLWSGEITLKKYGETLWTSDHKVVDLYHSLSETEVLRLMLLGENCRQTCTVKVPHTPHLPEVVRKLLESYLRLADWNQLLRRGEESAKIFNWTTSPEIIECRDRHPTTTTPSEQTCQQITDLIHEPSETALLDELESIKKILNPKTPISWLKETLSQELWEEEIFQGGDVPLPPGLQTIWDRLSRHLGFSRQIPAVTIRTWRLSLMSGNTECSGCCGAWLRASCLECGSPRCSFSFCSDFLKPCTTCQAIPPSCSQEQESHRGPAQPSINMHQVGELFIEAITEVAYDPVVAEALDQGRTEDSIHLAQDMRFKAVIRGWSHQEQQTRATALLRLNDISMTREKTKSPFSPLTR